NMKGVSWKGVFGRRIWETWEHLSALVATKRIQVSEVITHRFPLEAFQQGFAATQGEAGKVVFTP
ncbi:MAG TPA: hypothetical protein VMG58_00055, partial [Candidatus Sulfotelmatobacter sp.]|nr:hypothetical protein [Candidatus Sulfotelmatobacter sp.]